MRELPKTKITTSKPAIAAAIILALLAACFGLTGYYLHLHGESPSLCYVIAAVCVIVSVSFLYGDWNGEGVEE